MSEGSLEIGGVRRFFEGAAFPTFSLSLLLFYEILLVGLLFIPASNNALGAFAEDFRVWCYNFDPKTGRIEIAYLLGMLTPPGMLVAFILLFWWTPLREVAGHPTRYLPYVLVSALLVLGAAGTFALTNRVSSPAGEMPFPAESLRTGLHAPELRLINQFGEEVDLASLRGDVVMLTAVYTTCHGTCPVIISQAKLAVAALPAEARKDLRIIAVTMDPKKDSPDVLADFAEMYGLQAPTFQFVTGEPSEVESVLDAMNVSRTRDAQTGVIEHANLFLLIDRSGKLAYRLTLGERQGRWLVAALSVLLDEKPQPENG